MDSELIYFILTEVRYVYYDEILAVHSAVASNNAIFAFHVL